MSAFQTISKGEQINFSALPDRIGIVGSRSYNRDKRGSSRLLAEVFRFVEQLPESCTVVSGGALGVDDFAQRAALFYNRGIVIHWPDRNRPYPARFFERNTKIVDDVAEHTGVLVAFCDPWSCSGTEDTVRKAIDEGIPIVVFFYRDDGKFVSAYHHFFDYYLGR